MRQPSSTRNREHNTSWKWIVGVIIILIGLYFLRNIGVTSSTHDSEGLQISGSGSFVIIDKNGKKRDVENGSQFYSDDALLSIISGTAKLTGDESEIWLDKKNSEMSFTKNSGSGNVYSLSQGRAWIEPKNTTEFQLKHMSITLGENDIVLVEQQRIYSIAFVLQGDVKILTGGREANLVAGKRIMVSQSNLINPSTTLESLIGDIDDSIQQNAFFLFRNGQKLVEKFSDSTPLSQTGSITNSTGTAIISSNAATGKYISITGPIDGSVVSGLSFVVEGQTLSPLVKKVTINDTVSTIDAQSGKFKSSPVVIASESIDIVYKAYDAGNNVLERGILTLYSLEKKNGTEKLVPKTFPTNDKDFRIISPEENPYKTSASAVTVSGTVPKGLVEYITVNNFRLKKFTPLSTNWYYYANTAYQTMKDGFNLYEIRFYGPNDTLISTQLFTIIKEDTKTLSGE